MTPINKLVRDNIPDQILGKGEHCTTIKLDDYTMHEMLCSKLIEETRELRESSKTDSVKEELADVLTVLRAIAERHLIPWSEIEAFESKKTARLGAFKNNVFLLEAGVL